MLSDRAKALRPVIQAAFDAGGLDAICELFAKLEARIEELEKNLAAKGEENRKLLGARISVAKHQLLVARERGPFGSN